MTLLPLTGASVVSSHPRRRRDDFVGHQTPVLNRFELRASVPLVERLCSPPLPLAPGPGKLPAQSHGPGDCNWGSYFFGGSLPTSTFCGQLGKTYILGFSMFQLGSLCFNISCGIITQMFSPAMRAGPALCGQGIISAFLGSFLSLMSYQRPLLSV